MRKFLLILSTGLVMLSCNDAKDGDSKMDSDKTDSTGSTNTPQAEIADAKYMDIGKNQLQRLASNDIDGWMNLFSDNAVYLWSSGDSLSGKAAIAAYWKNRTMNVIDTIRFVDDIWLPVRVNTPQKGPDMPGIWLLSWYYVDVTYKNKKKVFTAVHNLMHFDSNDKVDRLIQYIDRAPINAATAGMK